MAGLAGQSGIVLVGDNLREVFGPGAVYRVATDAENGGIQFGRLDRAGIFGVSCERSVAGFAVDADMFSLILHSDDIGMASLAGFVTGKSNWPRRDLREGGAAIETILSKTTWDDSRAQDDECS